MAEGELDLFDRGEAAVGEFGKRSAQVMGRDRNSESVAVPGV
jgi:hypothetical protein